MRVKYIVIPGWVTSINDGDRHFIGGHRLVELYGVNIRECVIVNINSDDRCYQHNDLEEARALSLYPNASVLRPRYNVGDYRQIIDRAHFNKWFGKTARKD